jgi:ferredoxin
MLRKIVKIDEENCDGCGLCIPNCAEGALQVIDGKARLISDLFCDGLGACIGHCPKGAIEIVEREAEPYDDKDTHSCPGSRSVEIIPEVNKSSNNSIRLNSQLKQWPVQFHLVNPRAGYLRNADLLIAADCTAFAAANFHEDFLKGKSLVIACPKLDSNKDIYLEKLQIMIDETELNSITVLIMEVPCCNGLAHLAQQALQLSERKIPLNVVVMSIKGEILLEEES